MDRKGHLKEGEEIYTLKYGAHNNLVKDSEYMLRMTFLLQASELVA